MIVAAVNMPHTMGYAAEIIEGEGSSYNPDRLRIKKCLYPFFVTFVVLESLRSLLLTSVSASTNTLLVGTVT